MLVAMQRTLLDVNAPLTTNPTSFPPAVMARPISADVGVAKGAATRGRPHKSARVQILKSWFDEHSQDPYPTPAEKEALAFETGMEIKQIDNWFTNHRKRHWAKGSQLPRERIDDMDTEA